MVTVDGTAQHIYRVIVEKVLYQSVLVGAGSQNDAEARAHELASRVPRESPLWREEAAAVRDCTSVEMTDGSWEPCNALKEE
jgi:hypothetical protein